MAGVTGVVFTIHLTTKWQIFCMLFSFILTHIISLWDTSSK
uniref:Uncharacterized protein n=1 Tax=Arundo donax TaxID=35708 RepID=A0A0A9BFN2_ARUDO